MVTFKLPVPMVVARLEQARTALADVGVDLANHIPSIAVVGDQSTGKSSLLSALTNLRLPEGNGTCTRAPLKILIRPGIEHSVKLRYKLRTTDGEEPMERQLSAETLRTNPESLAALILDAQEAMKQRMDRIKAIGGDWQPHVLGDLDAQYWLLKDDIDLTVDLPTAQGPVMLVDLPGLHNPVGEAGFRIELEAFVKDKVNSENVIILSVTKASSALDGGDTSVTLASSIVYEADRESERTLTILTKADEVHDTRTNDALVAALKASKKHGCVLVATNPPDGSSEEACLARFKHGDQSDMLEQRGGGFGVQCLLQQLIKLQGVMVQRLDMPQLIRKLEKRGAEVDEKLGRFTSIPTSEAAADSKTDELLREVEKRFRDACKNAAFKVEGENATTGMIAAIDAAATSYVAKQSGFIPGILGRTEVLDIILDAARQDTKVNHCDIMSEYTTINLFLKFHDKVVEHGSEYVEQVHAAIRDTITGLLQHYLKEHPDLVKEAVAAAEQLLEEVVQPLKAAVKDVVLAHTYVVETLHNQVLYLTYQNLLMIASGILVNEHQQEQAQKLHDKDAKGRIAPTLQNLDASSSSSSSSSDIGPRAKVDQVDFLGALKSPGVQAASDPSAVGCIVGTTVGAVTTLALGSVLGPFASPLGASAGVLATKAWDLSKELLLKYKADYSAKSQDKASIKMSGFQAGEFQKDLVPLSWPATAVPMTSFELMCKMMNCDPSYVVTALDFYYRAFFTEIHKAKSSADPLGIHNPVGMQQQFIACLCRMLCTHYAMTESVNKLVRMRLLNTHPHVASSDPKCSLPNMLGISLLKRLRATHNGRMLRLVTGEEQAAKLRELQQKREGIQSALQHLKAAKEL